MLEERSPPLAGVVQSSGEFASVAVPVPKKHRSAMPAGINSRPSSGKESHWASYPSPISLKAAVNDTTARLQTLPQEELAFLIVDREGRATASLSFPGDETQVTPDLQQLMALAIGIGASGFVMIHNHPSGNASPSRQDIAVTRQISNMARTIGMTLFDHVIVTAAAIFSFRRSGLI